MKLAQIEYFLAASDTLNFTEAAKKLYVSQPALSKRIKAIEDELGVRLFSRDKRKVSLTEAGLSFKKDLVKILADLGAAVDKVMAIGQKQSGVVRIGCFQGAAVEDLIYRISEKSRKTAPQINISFKRGSFREVREALTADEVDVIFTLDFELKELCAYNYKVVFTERVAFVYSEKSSLAEKDNLSLSDFSRLPMLTLSPEASLGAYQSSVALIKKLGLVKQKLEKYDSWDTLLTYLKMGYGFTVLFENVCAKMGGLKQFRIPKAEFTTSVVAVWKRENALIESFISGLLNNR